MNEPEFTACGTIPAELFVASLYEKYASSKSSINIQASGNYYSVSGNFSCTDSLYLPLGTSTFPARLTLGGLSSSNGVISQPYDSTANTIQLTASNCGIGQTGAAADGHDCIRPIIATTHIPEKNETRQMGF